MNFWGINGPFEDFLSLLLVYLVVYVRTLSYLVVCVHVYLVVRGCNVIGM